MKSLRWDIWSVCLTCHAPNVKILDKIYSKYFLIYGQIWKKEGKSDVIETKRIQSGNLEQKSNGPLRHSIYRSQWRGLRINACM